ncbi:MAG: NAD(P)-binding domain-containing protein, partial [Burkholderiales bacterium]
MSARFERVAIIGVGLIGGSFALALKAAGACGSVIGVGRNPDNLARARALGVIDAEASDAGEAAEGADLILPRPGHHLHVDPVAEVGQRDDAASYGDGRQVFVDDRGLLD